MSPTRQPIQIHDVTFVVSRADVRDFPRPVVGVDGPVRGADFLFDHHQTGEPINLLAIPGEVPTPATIATTTLDADAVISAAVLLLRAGGEEEAVAAMWPVLHEAAYFCDLLGPSGSFVDAEEAGLGLFHWLKERGFSTVERGEVPLEEVRSQAFGALVTHLVEGIRQGLLPSDHDWRRRLDGMEKSARESVRFHADGMALLEPAGYVDPVAVYRAVDARAVILRKVLPSGRSKYSIGVSPKDGGRIDLRPFFQELSAVEPGWGGRATAGGSPMLGGSAIEPLVLLARLKRFLEKSSGKCPTG